MAEVFTDWLIDQSSREDAVGEVARYVRDDPCWTKPGWSRPNSAQEVDDHLSFHRAPYETIVAMREAWQEWGKSQGAPPEQLP